MSCWTEVFFKHGCGKVKNKESVPNDSSLKWSSILQQPDDGLATSWMITRNQLTVFFCSLLLSRRAHFPGFRRRHPGVPNCGRPWPPIWLVRGLVALKQCRGHLQMIHYVSHHQNSVHRIPCPSPPFCVKKPRTATNIGCEMLQEDATFSLNQPRKVHEVKSLESI